MANDDDDAARAWRFDAIPSAIAGGLSSIQPPTGEIPDYSFELKVMYCMRVHTIHKVRVRRRHTHFNKQKCHPPPSLFLTVPLCLF